MVSLFCRTRGTMLGQDACLGLIRFTAYNTVDFFKERRDVISLPFRWGDSIFKWKCWMTSVAGSRDFVTVHMGVLQYGWLVRGQPYFRF